MLRSLTLTMTPYFGLGQFHKHFKVGFFAVSITKVHVFLLLTVNFFQTYYWFYKSHVNKYKFETPLASFGHVILLLSRGKNKCRSILEVP